MMLRFEFRSITTLPPLAWCAELRRDKSDVVLTHGLGVETRPDAFFEGVWDGFFAGFGFRTACTTMGSGGCLVGERVCFVAPSHTYESLVTLADGDRMWVSNSIAFLLTSTGDAPTPLYPYYHRDLLRLQQRGITGDEPARLPTLAGRTLLLHAATDLLIDDQLTATPVPRPRSPEPRDFAEYRSLLAESIAALLRNAGDRARRYPLRAATTTSAGYDSPAASVLAAEAGLRDAITFEAEPHAGDSGRAIALRLGLTVHAIDPLQWRDLPNGVLPEFLSCCSGWAMLPMAGLAETWQGSMILLGSMGDEIWRRDRQDVFPGLARPRDLEPAFAGLRELRLRAGIAFVHVPTIGAVHAASIHRIARSQEMAPWSLGTAYDRPIPRRILETAGIPRGAFGHTIYMTIDTQTPEILRRLARTSFAAFIEATAAKIPRPLRRRLLRQWRWDAFLMEAIRMVVRLLDGAGRRLGLPFLRSIGKAMLARALPWQWHEPLPVLYTFHWGMAELIDRYRGGMGRESQAD